MGDGEAHGGRWLGNVWLTIWLQAVIRLEPGESFALRKWI
jgi:hypothetical protein